MTENNSIYFRQLLSGVDIAETNKAARQMGNFSYLVGDAHTRECMAVDPAWDVEGLERILRRDGMTLTGVLATHHHADHVGGSLFGIEVEGVAGLLRKHPVPVYVNNNDAAELAETAGIPRAALRMVGDGDKIKIGAIEVTFLHTPGHTPGSQCLRAGDGLISGDTLFMQGCGRVDLPGGDSGEMFKSLTQRLAPVGDEVVLYPGHNYGGKASAPLGEVRRANPYLRIATLSEWLYHMGG